MALSRTQLFRDIVSIWRIATSPSKTRISYRKRISLSRPASVHFRGIQEAFSQEDHHETHCIWPSGRWVFYRPYSISQPHARVSPSEQWKYHSEVSGIRSLQLPRAWAWSPVLYGNARKCSSNLLDKISAIIYQQRLLAYPAGLPWPFVPSGACSGQRHHVGPTGERSAQGSWRRKLLTPRTCQACNGFLFEYWTRDNIKVSRKHLRNTSQAALTYWFLS